ncbi:MAG: hypothetical protein KDA75_11225 [Planctomycetaceae bacterium]|nr:hypothetical protein [Planctomycetaceae bacterium]
MGSAVIAPADDLSSELETCGTLVACRRRILPDCVLSLGIRCLLMFILGLSTAAGNEASTDRPPSPALPERAAHDSDLSVDGPRGDLVVVLGAEGSPEFGELFGEWSGVWEVAAKRGGLRFHLVGDLVGDASTASVKTRLHELLRSQSEEQEQPLWIVMIGHGTFDGRDAKFNLLGEDVSTDELAAWLQTLERPVAVLQCASASAPFLEGLSGPNRVIISSTKSGQEINFARFGGFLAAAWADPNADLDKDSQVSLLEAFLRAARQTEEYYTGDNRLATEHPLIDDNGDARGTRAAAFAGVRPVREADSGATLDGYFAHQWVLHPSLDELQLSPERQRRRDELELQMIALRERKAELDEDAYYAALETILVELARVSLGVDELERSSP